MDPVRTNLIHSQQSKEDLSDKSRSAMGSPDVLEIESVSRSSSLGSQTSGNAKKSGLLKKFKLAVERAKKIGKGLLAMEKKGIRGIPLKEEHWPEAYLGHHPFRNTLGNKPVTYLGSKKREQYRVNFKADGTISQPLKGSQSFVIDAEGHMYMGTNIVGEFHHSSFLAGGAVAGAGEIVMDETGHIVKISNASGHYQPDLNTMRTVLRYLSEKGVNLSKAMFADVTRPGQLFNAQDFLEQLERTPSQVNIRLMNEDPQVRKKTLEQLSKTGTVEPEIFRAIALRLRDENESVRMAAVDALRELEPRDMETTHLVVKCLEDPREDVRYTALELLVNSLKARDSNTLLGIKKCVNDEDPMVASTAQWALEQLR